MKLKLTPSQAMRVLRACVMEKEPVMMVSAPGMGKSSMAYQLFDELGVDCLTENGVIAQPEDSKGCPVPDRDRKVTEFYPLHNLARLRDADRPLVCFFDDLGQAHRQMQAAYMQWVQDRMIAGIKISDNVSFVAATNGRGHKSGVDMLLSALRSRFVTVIQVKSDLGSWSKWYVKQDLPMSALVFFKWNPQFFSDEFFEKHISIDPETPTPNPRTYHALARMANMRKRHGLNQSETLAMYTGAVGYEVAVAYSAFERVFEKLPHPDEFIRNPGAATVFGTSDVAERWAVTSMLLGRLKTKDGDNGYFEQASLYVDRLPKEYQFFWYVTAPKVRESVTETKTYVKWSIENQEVMK